MKLIIDNVHDRLTSLAATSELLPIANTQRSGRSYPWRSMGTTQQTITGTLAAAVPVDGFVLYDHNLTPGATIQLKGYNDTELVYDSGARPAPNIAAQDLPARQWFLWMEAAVPITRYEITLDDFHNPDSYLQVGRILVGASIQPKHNPSYGMSLEYVDYSEHLRTEGLGLHTIDKGVSRKLVFDLDHIDSSELQSLSKSILRGSKGKDIYVSVFPDSDDLKSQEYAFVCRRESNYRHVHSRFDLWETQLTLVEV